MSRPQRAPTWTYIDEEIGHVPAEPGPEPRARHRHSRAQVRAQRHRGKRRDVSRACVCTCYLCYRRGGVDGGWWRKRNGLQRPAERRLLATGAADTAAALCCDGEDPEPPEPRDELARLGELCSILEVD